MEGDHRSIAHGGAIQGPIRRRYQGNAQTDGRLSAAALLCWWSAKNIKHLTGQRRCVSDDSHDVIWKKTQALQSSPGPSRSSNCARTDVVQAAALSLELLTGTAALRKAVNCPWDHSFALADIEKPSSPDIDHLASLAARSTDQEYNRIAK